MKDRPILMSGSMVRATLREIEAPGTGKTNTRRCIIGVPIDEWRPGIDDVHPKNTPKHDAPYLDSYCSRKRSPKNPRGMSEWWSWWTRDDRPCAQFKLRFVPGDRRWVRESHYVWSAGNQDGTGKRIDYMATEPDSPCGGFTPSIHMPRFASRLTLIVTSVKVERLQDISEADAKAEGTQLTEMVRDFRVHHASHRASFRALWDSLNGEPRKRENKSPLDLSWKANPWVVAVTFKPFLCNIDQMPQAEAA